MLVSGPSYDCCSACSPKIIEKYREDGWAFLQKALSEREWVTEISGLKEVQRRAEEMAGDVEWDSGSGEEEGEGELL